MQESVLSKEQLVNVLRQRVPGFEIGHVIGHAAQNHIGLHEIVTVHGDATVSEIFFCLSQGERVDVHFACRSAIKPAFAVNQVVEHPGGGAAADDEQQVVLSGTPAVPKVFESGKEAGTRGVEPGQLINKHHHLFLGLPSCIEQGFQPMEGIEPVFDRRSIDAAVFCKRNGKLIQLDAVKQLLVFLPQLHRRHGGVHKSKTVLKIFANQERFSDTSATINGKELRCRFLLQLA